MRVWLAALNLAALDPTLPALIGAIATLAAALGIGEWRRRARKDKANGAVDAVEQVDVDRQAAETILTQWKAVLEATQAARQWEADERRRCEERNVVLTKRVDELEAKVAGLEWEAARREWLETQPRRRKRADDRT